MELSFYIYLSLFLLAMLVSVGLSRLLPVAVALGALASLLASLFGDSLLLELLLLFGLTVVLGLVLILLPRRRESSLEAMVGHTCTVTERVDGLTGGQVRVGDGLWAARTLSADASYEEGATLTVLAIEGVKLICG